MMYNTHLAFGLLLGLLGIIFLKPANPILFIVIVGFASILPDIDHPDSKIGKKVKIIGFLFEHRGFFHSIGALVLFTVCFYLIFKTSIYSIAFALGYFSHLIMDAITIKGIMPFHPFSKVSIKGFVKTNSFLETVIFVFAAVFAFWLLLKM